MRDFWDDYAAPALVIVLLIIGVGWFLVYIQQNEARVDRQIAECVAAGGNPIVVGHQATTEFKACVMP